MRVEHGADLGTEQQVGVADNRCGDAAACAGTVVGFGDAVDELGFSQARQRWRTFLAIHGTAFHEHGRQDAMARCHVRQQVGAQIGVVGVVPEVMVGVDNGQPRLQGRLRMQRKPLGTDRQVRA